MADNLAFIDSFKCKLCRKCAAECPTGAILEINFPVKEEKPAGHAVTEVN
jgi:ferredoxin